MSKYIDSYDALDSLVNYDGDYQDKKEAGELIKQDLDRLKQLEKIFSDRHICEIKARFNEIECDADKCENCPLGIGDDICLKYTFEDKWKFQKERDKLKKIINFLKPHTYLASGLCEIKLVDEEVSKISPKYHNGKEVYEPRYNEFYKLLKEVLEDE